MRTSPIRSAARSALLALMLVLPGAATVAAQAPRSGRPDTVWVGAEPGELGPRELEVLGTTVRALRVEPDSIDIPVGGTLEFARLRVIALDGAGNALGHLRIYDRGATSAGVLKMRLWLGADAVRAGRATLRITYPSKLWKGDPTALPTVLVPVHVRP